MRSMTFASMELLREREINRLLTVAKSEHVSCTDIVVYTIYFVLHCFHLTMDFSIVHGVSIFKAIDGLSKQCLVSIHIQQSQHWNWTTVTRERFIKWFARASVRISSHCIVFYIASRKEQNRRLKTNQLPMPTWPAFSSVGVPGPLAGRESAPSVAL